MRIGSGFFVLFLFTSQFSLAQRVVHYATTNGNVTTLFATADPVARLHSGDILDTNTLDCFGNALKKPGDTLSWPKATILWRVLST